MHERHIRRYSSLRSDQETLANIRKSLSLQGPLILFDSTRIVPPVSAIKPLLTRLHAGHAGQEKTLSLATKLSYWPGMSNDVKTFVKACQFCYKRLPSR